MVYVQSFLLPNSRAFFITPQRNPIPISSHSSSPLTLSPYQPRIHFLSMDLPLLDTFIWIESLTMCPLHLASFTQHHVCKVHPCSGICQFIIPFYWQRVFHYMDIQHFVYPFTIWWSFVFFLHLFGYYECCCYEPTCIKFCVFMCFHFSWVYTPEWNCWIKWSFSV